jgi:DNA-binding NtrC family response regulator
VTQIVVINDESAGTDLLSQIVRDQGWNVVTCPTMGNAYCTLRSSRGDLVIVDIPCTDSGRAWDFITFLQFDAGLCATPVIVCSAHSDELLAREEWLCDHHIGILPKPFDLDELHRAIHAVLQR